MNWDKREEATNKSDAIVALTDGIANNIDNAELKAYAAKFNIPISLQEKAPSTPKVQDEPETDYEDDYYDDYYESSEEYYDSDCY
jgi:hypothetical protein